MYTKIADDTIHLGSAGDKSPVVVGSGFYTLRSLPMSAEIKVMSVNGQCKCLVKVWM